MHRHGTKLDSPGWDDVETCGIGKTLAGLQDGDAKNATARIVHHTVEGLRLGDESEHSLSGR